MCSAKLPRLGRGLEAIIPKTFVSSGKTISTIPIDDVVPNPYQPRLHFDDHAVRHLADSIREHGVAQPLLVRRVGDKFELVAGERRLRACKLINMAYVPVIIRDLTDKESLQVALIENLDREDLNAIEEAKGYQRLIEEFNMSHFELGKMFGKSRSAISNTLRLLQLPEQIQEALIKGAVSEGHARALLSLKTEAEMVAYLNTVIVQDLTVRETEELVSRETPDVKEVQKKKSGVSVFKTLQDELTKQMGIRIGMSGNEKKGRVQLNFSSPDELERILNLLKSSGAIGDSQLTL